MPMTYRHAPLKRVATLALLALLTACGSGGSDTATPPDMGASSPTTGACAAGSTATAWASGCGTPKPACVAGSWSTLEVDGMPAVRYQTAHFALRWKDSDVTAAQAAEAGKTLELVWDTYMNKVAFTEPYCDTAAKFKANVHIDPTFALTGGSTGGRDMGMWIGPGALADRWGLAHEFAHALQGSTLGLRDSPYVGWMWESHANWMTHQLDEFRGETHCSEVMVNHPHLYYGSTRDRYCNWQFWEFVKDKYCYQAVNDIWLKARRPGDEGYLNEDPFTILARNMGWSQSQLNDLFGEWALHNANWDYRDPDGTDQGPVYRAKYGSYDERDGERALRVTGLDPLDLGARRFAVPAAWAPQRWGYNLVRLVPDAGADHIDVSFRGVVQAAPATTTFAGLVNEPATVPEPTSDWRWGLVAVDASGQSRYSTLQRGADGELSFCLQAGDQAVWMVVMGTPSTMHQIAWDQAYYSVYRFPWMMQLEGAWPEGFQPNAPTPTASGRWHANGGGWVAQEASVADTAYVGPRARVLGGTVSGNARIEDHAVVQSGSVSGQAVVGGLTVLTGDTVVQDSARLETVFKGPGAFETGIVLSGTALLYGDVELRGVSLARGAFTGMVDAASATDAKQGANLTARPAEVTAPVSYAWRP